MQPLFWVIDTIGNIFGGGDSFIDEIMQAINAWLVNMALGVLNLGISAWNGLMKVFFSLLYINPMTDTSTTFSVAYTWVKSVGMIFQTIASSLLIIYLCVSLSKDALAFGREISAQDFFKKMICYGIGVVIVNNCFTILPQIFTASIEVCQEIQTQSGMDTDSGWEFPSLRATSADKLMELRAGERGEQSDDEWSAENHTANASYFDTTNNVVYVYGGYKGDDGSGSVDYYPTNNVMAIGLIGVIGCIVLICSGVILIFTVLSRWVKILMIIPLMPAALAGFVAEPGSMPRRAAQSWLGTIFTYALEIVFIVIAVGVCSSLFTANLFSDMGFSTIFFRIISIMLTTSILVGAVKGAEATVRRALGLG